MGVEFCEEVVPIKINDRINTVLFIKNVFPPRNAFINCSITKGSKLLVLIFIPLD